MEELEDFFWENYRKDLIREAKTEWDAAWRAEAKAEWKAEAKAEWMNKIKNIIKSFISFNPNCSIQEAAAQLGIEERLVRSVFPAGV